MFTALERDGYGEVSGTGAKLTFTAYPSRQVAIAESPSIEPTAEAAVIEYNWSEEVA